MTVVALIALIIAVIIPLVSLYLVYTQDLYKTGSFGFIMGSFAWGLIAYLLAARINPLFYLNAGNELFISRYNLTVRFVAPIVEEVLKGLVLLYLIRRPNFTYFVDGAIYGFAAGIGFAIIENVEYILGDPSMALATALSRVISTNLMHATGSALIGIALGQARFDHSSRRALVLAAGLGLAMILHVGYNNMVTRVENSLLVLVYAVAVGLSGAAFIVFSMKRGLAEERLWIQEKLGEADRVTAQEAAAVNKLDKMQIILAPIVQRFGPQKAAQVEDFLVIQARLGIMRKTLEKLQNDEKMRKAVEAQMADLRARMDRARRSVGTYCMLYLRQTFLEESSPIWGRIEAAIQQKISSGRASSGPSLWAKLENRMGTAEPTEKNE